jgi:hypothetical protein
MWTAITVAHVVPFIAAGIVLFLSSRWRAGQPGQPRSRLGHPRALRAAGANVVRPKASRSPAEAEARSVGLLGDLVGHEARALHARTGLVLERGRLGAWLVGPAGALLAPTGWASGRLLLRRVNDPALPSGDRIAHLLLALRADEEGFATVANLGLQRRDLARAPAAWRPPSSRTAGGRGRRAAPGHPGHALSSDFGPAGGGRDGRQPPPCLP